MVDFILKLGLSSSTTLPFLVLSLQEPIPFLKRPHIIDFTQLQITKLLIIETANVLVPLLLLLDLFDVLVYDLDDGGLRAFGHCNIIIILPPRHQQTAHHLSPEVVNDLLFLHLQVSYILLLLFLVHGIRGHGAVQGLYSHLHLTVLHI